MLIDYVVRRFYLISLYSIFLLSNALAQNNEHSFKAVVLNAETNDPLPGASVQLRGTSIGELTNANGEVEIKNLGAGSYIFVIRFVGFEQKNLRVSLPDNSLPATILLNPAHEELDQVVITTTRTSRSIDDIPTRIEFIGAEELEEKITMQPGNIRMVLSESTGIQTQQTSVSSANTTIRIQGLDGRFTQLLKDGFPLYGGFSGGLSIMQIPPLDLKQVDVVKGSSSTLYGGGAIAGIVNLISKTPEDQPETLLFGNATSAGGLDLSTFVSRKFDKVGFTLFGSRNSNRAYDPAKIGFSAIPKFTRYTINPKLFLYPNKFTSLMIGLNASIEERIGGDMNFVKVKGNPQTAWFEENDTDRVSTQLLFERHIKEKYKITLRNSLNFFSRDIKQRDYRFSGRQTSSFSELTFEKNSQKSDWVAGANLWTDYFDETPAAPIASRSFSGTTAGFFVQNFAELSEHISLETGLRLDNTSASAKHMGETNDWLLLPRLSVLFRLSEKLTSRLGGGLGYKAPTIFTEKAEEQVFKNVRPMVFKEMNTERSRGLNGDVNFTTILGNEVSLSVNQLLFYTRLLSPLEFHPDSLDNGVYFFRNSSGNINSAGAETNIKLIWNNFILFAGYTFVNAVEARGTLKKRLPLTARNRINSVLMYEIEESLRIGLEAFYFGPQQLTVGSTTPDYWIFGFSAQKTWRNFSLFINFENFTDTRQTRFGEIYQGNLSNPQFLEIYAPLDGFVFNAGIFVKL